MQLKFNPDLDYQLDAIESTLTVFDGLSSMGDAYRERGIANVLDLDPDTLQLERLVEFALEINELERVEHWLQQSQWKEDKMRQEALKLLQKSYYGQVKMIYIDPPYK